MVKRSGNWIRSFNWCTGTITAQQLVPARVATGFSTAGAVSTWPSVVLQGEGKPVTVCGRWKPPLSFTRYNVIEALLKAGSSGLSKDQLVRCSGHADAVNILKRL